MNSYHQAIQYQVIPGTFLSIRKLKEIIDISYIRKTLKNPKDFKLTIILKIISKRIVEV